ncbi:DUF1848 domain-containing protein [Candidatus Galacturonibacter soehngenii]|uniref:DUF1848 domain-containing protein n=1 Tax=Candidatus Galacturonatibacter soehngenii TaxID=2307010 RepID=A0A7V7QHY8_9FIRM|nr:DUF1848 domain-containing protein [Candidatus Galacturonibacter soehngenii]KAB1434517.1 DUF1848 domain-containing protein [Candidatus Galacturonibacter soehngenii]
MILSVSRRTDIPCFYSEWFFNRMKEGIVYVKNPMNPKQVSEILLTPKLIDCIIFWSKNPAPMLSRLDEIKDYTYCFQFTLTGYGKDLEPNLPNKKEIIIPLFQQLATQIGKERMIWRYDPIIVTNQYSVSYHMKAFEQIAQSLRGYTNKVIISFLDWYVKMKRNMQEIQVHEITQQDIECLASHFAAVARANHMRIETCAEEIDLTSYGIEHGSCIDKQWLEQVLNGKLKGQKDKNQRKECGCMESIEIGSYHTCINGCKYCYANDSFQKAVTNYKNYNPNSPILCQEVNPEDKITQRKIKSLKESQLSFSGIETI